MGTADHWAAQVQSRFPLATSPLALRSRLLLATMQDDACVAAVQLPGGTELQIHRVLAGRYRAENAVALCARRCEGAGGAADLRLRDLARLAGWWRRASLLQRLVLVLASPMLVLALPGYLLIAGAMTVMARRQGVRAFDALLPASLRSYSLEARSEDEARAALGTGVADLLVQPRAVGRFQVLPSVVVAERLLEGPDALDAFLADLGPWAR